MSREAKVVQTELARGEYEALVSAAKARNLTIKEAAKEALMKWTLSETDPSQDPIFRLRPVDFKTRVKASELEKFLYRLE